MLQEDLPAPEFAFSYVTYQTLFVNDGAHVSNVYDFSCFFSILFCLASKPLAGLVDLNNPNSEFK